jgi:hypothetical protein
VLHLVLTYFGALIWLIASSALPLRGAELCLDRPPQERRRARRDGRIWRTKGEVSTKRQL